MSDNNPCIASFFQKSLHRLRDSVGRSQRNRVFACAALLVIITTGSAIADIYLPNLFPFLDFSGFSGTFSTTGNVDLSGPFFQSLGTNGRTCATCHQPGNAFGLSAGNAKLRYFATRGNDPLFAQVDGATCPAGPVNNSLVVGYGLIRVGLSVPSSTSEPSAP